MATQIWQGSTGDWDTGGNWSGAAKPGNNDTVIFPASNEQAVTTGHTDENAIDPDLIHIQEGYDSDIGGSGSELYISGDLIRHEGGGALWLKAGDNAVDEIVINTQPAAAGATNATLIGTGTTDYSKIVVLRGRVTLGANMAEAGAGMTLIVGKRNNVTGDAIVTAGSGTTYLVVRQYGGTLTNESAITTLEMTNGVLSQDTATITTVNMTGGVLNYLFGGTIATVNLYGGLFDPTRSGVAKTVTTLNVYGGEYRDNSLTTYTTINDYRKAA